MTRIQSYKLAPVVGHEDVMTIHGSIVLPIYATTNSDGSAYRKLRRDLDMTIHDASSATGLRPSEVSHIELGHATVDSHEYEQALRAYKRSR